MEIREYLSLSRVVPGRLLVSFRWWSFRAFVGPGDELQQSQRSRVSAIVVIFIEMEDFLSCLCECPVVDDGVSLAMRRE